MFLTDILQRNAEVYGERRALTMRMGYRTVSLTYAEVLELSLRVADFLRKQGLQEGDRVLLLAPNSPYWICVFWGCLLHRCVIVPLNIQSTGELVENIAKQTEAKLLFKYLHFPQHVSQGLPTYNIDFLPELLEDVQRQPYSPSESQSEPDSTVQLLYTSGTTGDPKGVILTHRNLCSNLQALSRVLPLPSEARFLSILPLSHVFEQMVGFLLPFFAGAQIIFAHSPGAIQELLKEYRITHMAAVPEFLELLMRRIEARAAEQGREAFLNFLFAVSLRLPLQHLRRFLFFSLHRRFGGKLRTIASGGAPLDPALEERWNAMGVTILQGYGLTETSPVVSTNTYRDRRVGSVGKVLPGVEVTLGKGNEILVRGSNVFQGYYHSEEKTKEAFTSDGFYQTGDIGELNKDGFLFIRGRKKFMILGPGGQNIFAEDLEDVLRRTRGVQECCVLGVDREGHMEVHAVLLLSEESAESRATSEEAAGRIIEEANTRLASYQQITAYSVWPKEDFPRSATRKVKKGEVLQWILARGSGKDAAPLTSTTPLIHLLAEVSGVAAEAIHEETLLVRDLHIDSLLRIEIIARIEERFGKELPEASIHEKTTVRNLEEMMRTLKPQRKMRFRRWPRVPLVVTLRVLLQGFFFFPLIRIFVRLEVVGQEHLATPPYSNHPTIQPFSPPFVFMPNHVSYLDAPVVAMAMPQCIRRTLAFAAARDVVYGQFRCVSWLAELLMHSFPFPRKEQENIQPGLQCLGRLLDEGWSVVLFPEGRMSEGGTLLPLKKGAGLITTSMGVPVIPVHLQGTSAVLPYAKLIPRRRGVVTVTFGAPLRFKRSASSIEVTEELQKVMREMQ